MKASIGGSVGDYTRHVKELYRNLKLLIDYYKFKWYP